MIGKILGKKKQDADTEMSIEDLITLERFEEASIRLKDRIKKQPKDLHAHLRLAEVYVELKEAVKALDEFLFVADTQAEDGFFDKAMAIASKAAKLAPGDDTIPRRLEKYRNMKALEQRRQLAIEGLMANPTTKIGAAANLALEIELLWNKIAKSHLVGALSAEHLKRLFAVMAMHKMAAGEVVAREGETKPMLYLVVDGSVEARIEVNGKPMAIRAFTTGDIIGDSALLQQATWPATYVIADRATTFSLDRAGFEATLMGQEDPRAYISVLRQQNNDRDVAQNAMRARAGR